MIHWLISKTYRHIPDEKILTPKSNYLMNTNPKIFFSYAWGDDNETGDSREKLVDELYQSLLADNYHVVRDKMDLGYKGFISDFMQSIGEGECIVIAISNKYVRSPYCMFELHEVARNCRFDKQEFRDKVFPIMVESIDFSKPAVLDELMVYWKNELKTWNDFTKKWVGQLSIENSKRHEQIKLIKQSLPQLTEWLSDMNTLNPTILSGENFSIIKQAITSKLQPVQQPANTPPQAAVPASYKLPNIRKFLENALNDADFKTLCMDYFPEVENKVSDGMSKQQKINLLLDYCRRNIKFSDLLQAMEDSGNAQFDIYKPYR